MRAIILSLFLGLVASPVWATTAAVDHPGALPILLGLDKVRAELKVNSLQRAVLDSLRSEYKTEARKLVSPMPQTAEQRVAAEKQLIQLTSRYNNRALSVLNDGQKKRLQQIEHQLLGATALFQPGVQKQVGVTPQQKAQFETIRQKGVAYVGKINRQFEEGRIGHQEKLDLLRDRRLSQGETLLRLLTPEQRDAFNSLGGSKFAG